MSVQQDTRVRMYERLRRIVEKHAAMDERPFRLSDTMALSPRDVRTIEFLSQKGTFNVTSVADHFRFTKSAASQLVNRLVRRGVVHKEISPHSDKEYHLRLTDAGLEAYRLVQAMDQDRLEAFLGKIDGFSRQQIETAGAVLEAVEKMMDERMEQSG
ncbi:MarR family winged helix-turn-helix transcriptional regulator [Pseudodesulfovibrio alkaliphilus]|nr:MarR family transcriptional regulator [Pseudodesulfovibrio alkaliphilus]